ncbi:MAG: ribonuclease Y [Planctomycetales bacterium]
MEPISIILTAIVSILGSVGLVKGIDHLRQTDAKTRAEEILAKAGQEVKTRAKEAELELKEKALRQESDWEKESTRQQKAMLGEQRELDRREAATEQKSAELKKQEKIVEGNQRKLAERIAATDEQKAELAKTVKQQQDVLQQISAMTRDEAVKLLLGRLETELEQETSSLVMKHQKKVQETCQAKSREAIITAMQRYAASHTAETTTSTVALPSDDMKGRIIGRDGRNIRAFEKATGIDVIIDDTPGMVVVSGFDAVRREIARLSLEKLIADGRIHPSRIEEIVGGTQKEMDARILELGQEAAEECDVHGLQDKILSLMGRLHFRTSYSQNVLRHSIEVAFLTGMMAEEIGMDGKLARRCGLLHDIGKAADHEMEGGHPKVGADLLKRHGENKDVVHAAFGHHDDLRIDQPYTVLVAAADACSASRPGARRESLERYVKRLEELEGIANGFPGVEQSYAIQAGRELRVIAGARDTNDASAAKLCRDIAKAIEEQMTYPGEIKVTVLREICFSGTAK